MDWKALLNGARRRPSSSTIDHRAEFERDYDRAIFSTPVKRLQDKTQVFPLDPSDAVRTRLTHSLEVSSVARGIARKVSTWLGKEHGLTHDDERSIEAIAMTCALIHDLGNPPFGHAGEAAIQSWFHKQDLTALSTQQQGDFLLFEGNAQTMRLVSKLQILADFNGLNLTYGSLSALRKYIAPSTGVNKDDQARSKPGYFASEADLISDLEVKTGTGDARNPITYIVEAADDIVYSIADIEDAVKKGVLRWHDLDVRFQALAKDKMHPIHQVLDGMKKIIDAQDPNSVMTLPDDTRATALRTAVIGYMVPQAFEAFKTNYTEIMAGTYTKELVASPSIMPLMSEFRDIGRSLVYPNQSTLRLEVMGRKIIMDLMDIFWEGAQKLPVNGKPKTKDFHGRIGALLSPNYRDIFQNSVKQNPEQEGYYRYQLVTDYICGMTDSFAKRLHSELMNG